MKHETNEESKTLKTVANNMGKWWLVIAVFALVAGGVFDIITVENTLGLAIMHIISVALVTFGSVVLTSAVGTILYRKTGFAEVFKEQLVQIICSSRFIKMLKKDTLQELKRDINEEIYSMEIAKSKDSILNTVVNSIEPLLEKYYFQRYDLNVYCKINGDFITKTITRKMIIKSTGDKNLELDIADFFSATFAESELGDDERVELREFVVNKKSYKQKVKIDKIEAAELGSYKQKYFLNAISNDVKKALTIGKQSIKVKIVVKTKTMLDDNMFIHKIPVACKEYKARVDYKNDECKVIGAPFGFMDTYIDEKCSVEQISEEAIEISFSEWILPGDGVVFVINKN